MGTMRILRQIRLELPLVSTMQLSVLIYMVIHVYLLCHSALEHNKSILCVTIFFINSVAFL